MKITREFKIGIVVLLGIVLLVWGFNFLKGTNIFMGNHVYYSKYERIDGLAEANPVLVNGVKVGQVKGIEFVGGQSARILVAFTVDADAFRIPTDSRARIVSANLMGDKSIQLILGSANQFYEPGDTIASEIEESLSESVPKIVLPLQQKANDLMGSLDSVLSVIQYIFNEGTSESIKESFIRVRNTIKNFEKTSGQLDNMFSDQSGNFSTIMGNLASISGTIRNNNSALENAIRNFSNISDTLARANISETLRSLNGSLSRVAGVMEKVEKGEGTAGKLLQDPDLYEQMTKASKDLDLLLEDIRLNPKRYFAPLGKRKPYQPPPKP